MNFNYQLSIFLISVFFVCFGITAYLSSKKLDKKTISEKCIKNVAKKTEYTVGIVSLGEGSVINHISKGFKETLSASKTIQYTFRQSSAHGDRILAKSLVEEFVDSNVDLIFTIGTVCSQLAQKITQKRKVSIPIVFGAVIDPAKINLVASEASSGNNLTGVAENNMSWKDHLDILYTIKPAIKHAAIVCNFLPGQTLETDVITIKNLLERKNVRVDVIPIYNKNEVIPKAKPFLTNDCDVLFCLRDTTVMDCIDGLVKICNRARIILFSMYLDSVNKGAALGFGIYEKMYGIQSAKMAQKILEEGILPRDIPIQRLDSSAYRLQINKQAAAQQGLHLDPTISFLIKNANIV